ncbi:MAG: membrane protein insertion efficiency factor YidD [Patescibacteria group bacterium]|nr:membrane protein insertion efficiency factor YidD [Patescibacteria group bacterium]
MTTPPSMAARVAARSIGFYQRVLSPDHGMLRRRHPYGFCRFYPTCSEYSRQAFLRAGFWRGLSWSLARLGRCHPWSAGGVDEVPR